MAVSQESRQQLASNGVAPGSTWGGPQKHRYYTPSGEEVWASPSIRAWSRKDSSNKVIKSGTRDANLDKGWTLAPPDKVMLNCGGCSRWHETADEVAECVMRKTTSDAAWERKARAQVKGANTEAGGRLDKLETDMSSMKDGQDRIESLLEKLLKGAE